MRGLNSDEIKELIDYINEHNSVERSNPQKGDKRKIVKHVNFSLDTSSNKVWAVNFTRGRSNKSTLITGPHLKDQIYKWLNSPDS